MKNACPFYIVFQVFKVHLIKIYEIHPPDLLNLVVFISFYIWIPSIFHKFLELHSTISEEKKCFFNGFTSRPPPPPPRPAPPRPLSSTFFSS